MTSIPSFLTGFLIGLDFEARQLLKYPPIWLLCSVGVVIGAVSMLRVTELVPVFGPLSISMYFTVVTMLWAWHSTALSLAPALAEVYQSRAVDEAALHVARVVIAGSFGLLLSVLFLAGALLVQPHQLALVVHSLAWLPHVVLAHMMSAAIGGCVALLILRPQVLSLLTAVGSWVGVLYLSDSFGPNSPDPMLLVLHWNTLWKYAGAEPLVLPMLGAFVAATTLLLCISASVATLRTVGLRLTPPVFRSRIRVWWGVTALVCLVWVGLSVQWTHRQHVLMELSQNEAVDRIELHRTALATELTVVRNTGTVQLLRGPVRPTSGQLWARELQPYIGRFGVALPLYLLSQEMGHYAMEVYHPHGWVVVGCQPQSLSKTVCTGTDGTLDWLVMVPEERISEAEQLTQAHFPLDYPARELFRALTSEAMLALGEPAPYTLFMDEPGAWWIRDNVIAGPHFRYGTPGARLRRAHYEAALTITSDMVGLRRPREDSSRFTREPSLPLPLLATVDRLLFDFSHTPINEGERLVRAGQGLHPELLTDWVLPVLTEQEFNDWWSLTDKLLVSGQISASELWAILREAKESGKASDWSELAQARWGQVK